jgi:hypothetical protein
MKNPTRGHVPPRALALKGALLMSTHSSRRRRNIERVWIALEALRQRGAQDFRIPAVARELGDSGPKEQSIRNREGEVFRQLISAYAEEVAPSRTLSTLDDDELALSIPDPSITARIGAVLAQNRALRLRNDLLHEQFAMLCNSTIDPSVLTPAPPHSGGADFSAAERKAVAGFLRGATRMAWTIDDASGAILDERGNEVAPPYFVDALRKIVTEATLLLLPARH